MPRVVQRLRRSWPGSGARGGPDPFQVLELQHRLTRLARELHELDRDDGTQFARAHHARAALLAYEDTLDEACRLIGHPVEPGGGAAHRLLAEAGLREAGWTW